ncbi:hypothetical protein [Bacillus sp. S/N-304-OC-R1]|uniref:hypothetical protein n=1 Tax=Bacillus sp. S/N-304-OC-R1 TaxID=2758034 RepID=UPI001C8E8A5A|nr:hypothetical protein [Bacillus sp. S/N-304-OC-R1]MBY0120936.1 hypothetical protein [Bacillus sp. S/N-304-OC-R1]
MSNSANDKKKPKNISTNTNQNSGTEYHIEHAGHVEGYGETYSNAKNMSDTTDN